MPTMFPFVDVIPPILYGASRMSWSIFILNTNKTNLGFMKVNLLMNLPNYFDVTFASRQIVNTILAFFGSPNHLV